MVNELGVWFRDEIKTILLNLVKGHENISSQRLSQDVRHYHQGYLDGIDAVAAAFDITKEGKVGRSQWRR